MLKNTIWSRGVLEKNMKYLQDSYWMFKNGNGTLQIQMLASLPSLQARFFDREQSYLNI